jgi:hypothetical protein
MKRLIENNIILVARRFYVFAAVCFLTVFTANAATPWKFTRTYISQRWNNAVFITPPEIDLNGGKIDLMIRDIDKLCSGGSEKLRITWRFDRDISQFNPNDTFGATLRLQIIGTSGGCTGQLSGRTQAVVTAGRSGGPNWGDIVGKRLDDERFVNKSFNQMANGSKDGPNTVNSIIALNSNEPYADRPAAGFIVFIEGPGGDLRILYAYEPVGKGNACGFSLGSGIFDKWQSLGGEQGLLGCPIMSEAEAGSSPQGTTGRYAKFSRPREGSAIHWHRTGKYAGQAFETHGAIYQYYSSLGGTNSWLGFPISDEFSVTGGRQSNFEGGYIVWDATTGRCQAFKYNYETDRDDPKNKFPNLGGTWYGEGNTSRPASVQQSDDKLTFTNEKGDTSRGHFESANVVVADDWQGGLRGRLNADRTRITWANGSMWQRGVATNFPNIAGTWYFSGNRTRPASITQSQNSLSFKNEKGDVSGGHFESYYVVVADSWGGLRGRVNQALTRIDWANGSFWER